MGPGCDRDRDVVGVRVIVISSVTPQVKEIAHASYQNGFLGIADYIDYISIISSEPYAMRHDSDMSRHVICLSIIDPNGAGATETGSRVANARVFRHPRNGSLNGGSEEYRTLTPRESRTGSALEAREEKRDQFHP
jgi:hypothetical protein